MTQNYVSKSFAYTLNNYTDSQKEHLKLIPCAYHVCGYEIGEQGTPHIQGTITFSDAKRFNAVKEIFEIYAEAQPHIERCISVKHSRAYCKKDGNFWESGPEPTQGSRTDLSTATAKLLKDRDLSKVAEEYPEQYVKYHSGLGALLRDTNKSSRKLPKVFWLYGPSGTGKTRFAMRNTNESNVYITSNGIKWFDGYNSQSTVIFDDFPGGNRTEFKYFLRLLDRYPVSVEVKGGTRPFTAHRIYITGLVPPEESFDFQSMNEDPHQLIRRIFRIGKFYYDSDQVKIEWKQQTQPGTFSIVKTDTLFWTNELEWSDESDTEEAPRNTPPGSGEEQSAQGTSVQTAFEDYANNSYR